MIVGGNILLHGEKHAATVEDRSTVRIIRDMLKNAIAEHEAVAASIKDEISRADYEEVFADDIRRCNAVIAICESRMAEWCD